MARSIEASLIWPERAIVVIVLKARDNRVATALRYAALILAALESGLPQGLMLLDLDA